MKDMKKGSQMAYLGGVFTFRHLRHRDAIQFGDRGAELVASTNRHLDLDAYVTLGEEHRPNLVPDPGLLNVLEWIFGQRSQVATWYLPLFVNDVPVTAAWGSDWASAGSGTGATELQQSDFIETGRQPIEFNDSPVSGEITSSTIVTYTFASGVSNASVYGGVLTDQAAINSSNANGVLLSATKLAQPRLGISPGDKFQSGYVFRVMNKDS